MLVLDHGHLIKHASPQEIFSDQEWVKKHYLDEPATSRLTRELQKGGFQFSEMPLTIESLVSKVANELKKKGDMDE